jgi:fermentation-respiration switch protein FrsA (DUF1100 family)
MEARFSAEKLLELAGRAETYWKKKGLATRGTEHNEDAHRNFTRAQTIGRVASHAIGDVRLNEDDLAALLPEDLK